MCIYHVMKIYFFSIFFVFENTFRENVQHQQRYMKQKIANLSPETLPLGLDHPNLDACQLPSDFFDGSATWRCGLKLEDLTFEWAVFFQTLTWIKRLDHFCHVQKISPTKIRKHHCFLSIDMSTEERSWKDCPKGGAVTQALEMPTLTVSALLKGYDFYLKGCCETKSTSTFFVIAVKEVSKNDGNGILKITIVGLTSKISQTGLVSRWSERVSWEAARIASVNISDVASPLQLWSYHTHTHTPNCRVYYQKKTMMGGVSCVCVVLGHAWASCYLIFWSSYRVASPIRATELGQKMQNKQNKQWTNLLDDTCLPRPNFQNFKVLNGLEGYVIRTIAWFQRIP